MEKYLHRWVDSILAQSFKNFELILIDDGSKDASAGICESYAETDNRVTVIRQKNQGVSAARNAGLDRCRGEWVCFVDADDYISDNYLMAVEGSRADIMIVNYITITPQQEKKQGFTIPQQIVYEGDLNSFFSQYILSCL